MSLIFFHLKHLLHVIQTHVEHMALVYPVFHKMGLLYFVTVKTDGQADSVMLILTVGICFCFILQWKKNNDAQYFKGLCPAGYCLSGGTCELNGNTIYCVCPPTHTGPRCETAVGIITPTTTTTTTSPFTPTTTTTSGKMNFSSCI